MRDRRLLPLIASILFSGASLTFADQVVYFVNGKAIIVKSLEKGEKFTVLEMEGGGRIGVPTDQIAKIEDYVVSAPAVVQTAPQQTAPVLPAQTGGGNGAFQPAIATGAAQTGNPPGLQPTMSAVPGPGVGGRPAGGPNGGLAGKQPLDIGGVGSPMAPQRPLAQAGGRPGVGGPGGPSMGPGAGRPNFPAGRRLAGRGPLFGGGRGGRGAARLDEPVTPPAPPGAPSAAQSGPPAQPTQPPVVQAPPPNSPPEEPPAPPDDSNEEPSDPSAPPEGDSSGDTPGSAS
jgi:hypothetical protein